MLSPEQIEVLADAAVSAFFRLDTLARSKAAKALSDPIRVDSQAIIQAIMRSGAESREDISRVITATLSDAARTALSADEAAYAAARNAGLVAPYAALADSAAIQRLLESGIATALDMANLTGTSALNAVSSEFTSALDTAVIGIRSGRLTPDEAIREAIDRIARTDTMVSYESGDMSLYGAVRRSVLTGAHQMTGRMQEARLREIGAEHVEISAHAGARPEHAEWQGQVVRFDDLAEVTGYGSGEGLLGWNCSHDFMPYFPEIMEPTDNSYLDSRDAEEDYALSQRQRECERNIRQYAARAEIYRAGGITGEAKRNEELAGRWRNEARDTARLREGHVRPSREAIYP